ncbi:glycosyltransferase family 4 protein [Algoriphagus sp. A40]|uniref:glycosyltransferase family 4 protein n=1 Tax=Algoriphagus sp. A40 TaxID=1945863 RepID=UPI0009873FA2|nr:glycosyltransferase family 4 protein [Algoriphagus sp. A40]OOG68181.1 hypothetical protein B0E43_22535 [Algoriphagus sp. A40]
MDLTRILILDTSPIRRGAQVFGEELAAYLNSKRYRVKRIYLFRPTESQIVSMGAENSILPFFENSHLEKFPSFQPGLLLRLKNEIKDFEPQIILCNGSKTLKYGAWIRFFGFNGKGKVTGRFIDDAVFWNNGGIKKWAYSNWINRLDGMVAVSQSSLDSMIRHYKFQKPSRVIHRVFDPGKFENAPKRNDARTQLGIGENDEVLLFLGNLTAQKRPDRFLEIVKQLIETRPNLKALLVGDGELGASVKSQISNLKPVLSGVEVSQILFFGYQQDVSPFLAAADILVLPSDTEGLPGVVLEAAHFGVPTIASEVGGIRECLIDGETGMLVPDRTVFQFCEKISFLLDHPKDRKAMGERAKSYTSQHFRMDQVVDQYLDFFQSISPSK